MSSMVKEMTQYFGKKIGDPRTATPAQIEQTVTAYDNALKGGIAPANARIHALFDTFIGTNEP